MSDVEKTNELCQAERGAAWRCMNCILAPKAIKDISTEKGIPWEEKAKMILLHREEFCKNFEKSSEMSMAGKKYQVKISSDAYHNDNDGNQSLAFQKGNEDFEIPEGDNQHTTNAPFEEHGHLESEKDPSIVFAQKISCAHFVGYDKSIQKWVAAFKLYFKKVKIGDKWTVKAEQEGRLERMCQSISKLNFPVRTKLPVNEGASQRIGDVIWGPLCAKPVLFTRRGRAIFASSIAKIVMSSDQKERLILNLRASSFGSVGDWVLSFIRRDFERSDAKRTEANVLAEEVYQQALRDAEKAEKEQLKQNMENKVEWKEMKINVQVK